MYTGDDDDNDDGLSTGAAVAISVVVTFFITLVVTALISVFLTRMYYKRQLNKTATTKNSKDASTQDNSQFILTGRDIKMDSNPAYAMMEKDTIKMDTNPAYAVAK